MAQRRSRNRRSSARRSSNVTGDFNENTNIIDNDDPLWFNRTIIRPSTSLVLTKHASSILNSDSTIDTSEISGKWFDNLSRSESSKLMADNVRKNVKQRINNGTSIQPKEDSRNIKRQSLSNSSSKKINQLNTSSNEAILDQGAKKLRSGKILIKQDIPVKIQLTKYANKNLNTNSDAAVNSNDSNTDDVQKRRPNLFSQESKERTEKNSFDAALEDNNISNKSNTTLGNRSKKQSPKHISPKSFTTDSDHNNQSGVRVGRNISSKRITQLLKEKQLSEENAFDEVLESQNLTTEMDKTDKSLRSQRISLRNKLSQVLNNSQSSLKYMNKSNANKITDVSSLNESIPYNKTKNDSKEISNENESSSLPKYIRRTKSYVPNASTTKQKFMNSDPVKEMDVEDHIVRQNYIIKNRSDDDTSDEESYISKKSLLSSQRQSTKAATSLHSQDKSAIENRGTELNEKSEISGHEMSAKEVAETSKVLNLSSNIIKKINKPNESFAESYNKELLKQKFNRIISRNSPSTEGDVDDDLLRTPHPAQSTLNPSGRPFTRLTEFRSFETDESSSSHNSLTRNVVNTSNTSKKGNDLSVLKGVATSVKETSAPNENERQLKLSNNAMMIDKSLWEIAKKKVDLIKEATLANLELEKKRNQELEQKNKQTDAKVKRTMALKQAKLKMKKRKPINKAYYVDGKLYKQPKLSRPKNWATDRLYKYLWNRMEPLFRSETRIESEKFVQELSKISSLIIKRKKYESYSKVLEKLLVMMARLNLIKTRYDFYRFCRDFMPYDFRIKVVPMKLPGNVENIPYNQELVCTPILQDEDMNSDSISNDNA
ncbi:PREDICTED: putative uncharacterized protein DDB_G0277255 [Ceratosolen solmsi marchali]|uniref:Uncharacterized protein n=1 Tax=Ceratosolen solmsi marchali TaxID=326594 RepID=A0AAJ6YWE1_9HYME|nr:PREDICTED: putative uncharacterized protein DDB_G0277255 [Ceratosolen solmsi marchali]